MVIFMQGDQSCGRMHSPLRACSHTVSKTVPQCVKLAHLDTSALTPETQGFSLKSLKHLVLDEADKLLDMDFEQEIDQVLKVIPRERRTQLFSATMTSKVQKLQRACLVSPVKVEVASKYSTGAHWMLPDDPSALYMWVYPLGLYRLECLGICIAIKHILETTSDQNRYPELLECEKFPNPTIKRVVNLS